MPAGRAGKVSTHPFAMVVWDIGVEEKGGGIVEQKKIAQHRTEMYNNNKKYHGSEHAVGT